MFARSARGRDRRRSAISAVPAQPSRSTSPGPTAGERILGQSQCRHDLGARRERPGLRAWAGTTRSALGDGRPIARTPAGATTWSTPAPATTACAAAGESIDAGPGRTGSSAVRATTGCAPAPATTSSRGGPRQRPAVRRGSRVTSPGRTTPTATPLQRRGRRRPHLRRATASATRRCGNGYDRVRADLFDAVAADCERVVRRPGGRGTALSGAPCGVCHPHVHRSRNPTGHHHHPADRLRDLTSISTPCGSPTESGGAVRTGEHQSAPVT